MDRVTRPSLRPAVAPLVLCLLIAACGGGNGGSTGVDPHAPVLSNLQIRALDPQRAGQNVRYVVGANYTDIDGDVGNGQCEVLLNGQSIGRVTLTPAPGTPANATSGAVACLFFVNSPAPQQITGTLRIFDAAGHQSNDLGFVIGLTQLPGGREPARGPVKGRLESATVGR